MLSISHIPSRTTQVLKNPLAFALRVLAAFRANQGLLLAGAVAYYALLSIVPLLILIVIALSHVIDQAVLLRTISKALEYVVPGASNAVVAELKAFLDHREVIGWVLFITMLFFSSLGFKVLENAISVIFLHRVQERRRHWAISLLLPFVYIISIGVALMLAALLLADLTEVIGDTQLIIFSRNWPLVGLERFMLYFSGLIGEILLISAIYFFMPVCKLSVQHALIGGTTAALLWEIIRHALSWFFGTLSQVNVVYGSLATSIIVLLSLEVAATLLLLGAQVIAEYERLEVDEPSKAAA